MNMHKNLVIKNIIFIVGILLVFGMFSQFVIPNHIERTEEQREQSDIEMIETMQRAVIPKMIKYYKKNSK